MLVKIKNSYNNYKLEYDILPKYIYLPINNLIKNEYVYKNEIFGNFITSISGKIKNTKKMLINNKYLECYEIKNDYQENTKIKTIKANIKNKEQLKNLLNKMLLDNILIKINKISKISNLIISCIDEDIDTFNEDAILKEHYIDILSTIDFLKNIFKVKEPILAIKNIYNQSIKKVNSIKGTYPNIKLVLIENKYLINRLDFLTLYLNIKQTDTLLLTINDIYNIYNVLNGKYNTEKVITISGNTLNENKVINIKVGVSLKELIDKYIEINEKDYEVYLNGKLQGYKVSKIDDVIITNEINSILINKKEIKEVNECINCGACKKICPYNIDVKDCFIKNIKNDKCINCGLCNFICPSNIDLKKVLYGDQNEK